MASAESVPWYESLTNAQNIGRAVAIYSGNKELPVPESPTLVILVGSPAVGKTTQARRILAEQGMDYENFYNVSLDSLAEVVKPYRNATRRFYNAIKERRPNLEGPFPANTIHPIHEYMPKFSGFYMTTIQSQRNNFGMTESSATALKKLNNPAYKPSAANKRKANSVYPINNTKLSLTGVREEAFKVGLQSGYDIIYDTTLSNTKDKILEILKTVEENAPTKYKILVVHVTAPQPDIEARMRGRQEGMIADPEKPIRGIPYTQAWMFIKENKEAFQKASKFYSSGQFMTALPGTSYTPADFTFLEVNNPTLPKGGRRRKTHKKHKRSRTLKK